MSTKSNDDTHWDSCPSGLLFQAAELRLETPIEQHKRKRQVLLWMAISSTLLLMLVCYSVIEAEPVAPNYDASISCQTVQGNLAAFCNNQIHEVSLERKIGKHLIDCKSCRRDYLSTCESVHKCPNRIRKVVTKPCMKKSFK